MLNGHFESIGAAGSCAHLFSTDAAFAQNHDFHLKPFQICSKSFKNHVFGADFKNCTYSAPPSLPLAEWRADV